MNMLLHPIFIIPIVLAESWHFQKIKSGLEIGCAGKNDYTSWEKGRRVV